jgi:glycosyltransferase involved in cell wall biosynthesis
VSQPQHQGQLQELSPRARANAQGRVRDLNLDDIEIEVVQKIEVVQDPPRGIKRGSLDEIRMVPDSVLSLVTVSVVLPTLNEADNLAHVFERMPSDVFEVILVDGDSTDGTVEVAKGLWPGLTVIKQSAKGKGNALSCGFWAATGDIIVMLDADGSTDPAEIPRFVGALLAGADFAKGSRFIAGGGSADITTIRRIGNWALAKVVNSLWGGQYSDLCYGYNAFWRRCLPLVTPDCEGFEVETLMNIRAARARLRIHEVPSFEYDRRHGTSNLHARRDGIRVLRTILSERVRP